MLDVAAAEKAEKKKEEETEGEKEETEEEEEEEKKEKTTNEGEDDALDWSALQKWYHEGDISSSDDDYGNDYVGGETQDWPEPPLMPFGNRY